MLFIKTEVTMAEAKKSLLSSMKDALAKKHAAQHPDAKESGVDGKKQKQKGPPSVAGRPVKKAAARGR
jgi:hypothetical protein